jgi:rod shape-determining protein MreC
MESFFSRYRNLVVLMVALLVQVLGLAVQVRKTDLGGASAMGHETRDGRSVRLIRLWAAELVTPVEAVIHGSGQGINNLWNEYIDLRHTRDQNQQLQRDLDRMRLEQATLIEDARQGQRLQALLKFQQSYIYKTIPAQVIGTSGSTQSHVLYIDKGSADGLAQDMAVVTPDGIVGKVRDVFPHSSQVLVINDQTSGAGVILEKTRTRGILRGNAGGEPQVIDILADQRIQPGEHVLTAGGDQIFPRGLPVGVVQRIDRDPERGSFIHVIVKPAADLQHLDEVLVLTSLDAHLSPQEQADLATSEDLKGAEVAAEAERKKAAAEMEERLPGLKDPNAPGNANDPNAPKPAAPLGPDGKPLPVVPPTPKPLPAAHPDRFSPGGAAIAHAPAAETQPDANPDADSGPTATKPPAKTPTPKTQSIPKPQGTKPANPTKPQGRLP